MILKPEVCVGTDISEKALKIAKANGENLAPMVKFIQSDLFENVTGSYDLIISNPPIYYNGRMWEADAGSKGLRTDVSTRWEGRWTLFL